MGGLWKQMPITYAVMLIGTLAITGVGIPDLDLGFAGFYSKDAIIDAAYAAGARQRRRRLRLRRRRARRGPDLVLLLAADLHDLPRHAEVGHAAHATAHATRTTPRRSRRHDAHGHDDHHGLLEPHESPLGDADPAAACWRSARSSPAASSSTPFVGEGRAEFWRGAIFNLPAQPRRSTEASSLPPLGGLGAAGGHRDRLRRRLVGLHPPRGHGRADRRPQGPALELPLQQVVLRRALRRRSSCAAPRRWATCSGRAATRRSSTASAPTASPRSSLRGRAPRRPAPDRLRLPLRLRHAARAWWRCCPTRLCFFAGRALGDDRHPLASSPSCR